MKNIAIFASGAGTNAENIIRYFSNRNSAKVVLVLSNRREAGVLKRAEALGINTYIFDRNDFYVTGSVLDHLMRNKIDFIVLAGFLWLVPNNLLKNFTIINIHPALLPKYGGKGMFGMKVHEAVVDNKETESGITIHYVNEHYDEGQVIFQARCPVLPTDTPEMVASKVHELEYLHFPRVIGELLMKR